MNASRRDFLKYSSAAAISSLAFPSFLFAQSRTDVHEEICLEKFALGTSKGLAEKSMPEVITAIGLSFLKSPYKGRTLESGDDEQLIVNLKEFDCVTFVETTLALSRCTRLGTTTFDDFKNQLQLIRYRGGVINGYPSRLHYFSDWIDDNGKKQIVRNITHELGGIPYEKPISFMSTHRSVYNQLGNDDFFAAIKQTEDELNARQRYYLPKNTIRSAHIRIADGDILAITTSINGLDILHTGIALRHRGTLRMLHAPLSGGSIQITQQGLADHLSSRKNHTGIMVARPVDPDR
ncbi:MAG: DUF1460 domain-containing protein [Bacteroidetes bacterium]|nr:DUF1460 domain-containing protein [Bacteroidota bacterium]MCW5894508.1 DUF1460 domain-containing protein [Bacteroidota bacterium]